MDLATQQKFAQIFRQLHRPGDPLILFNAWDVASAKEISRTAPAVATSSGAVAGSLGYRDGQQVPLDLVIRFVSRLTQNVHVPVSVDFEAGYGDAPADAATSVAQILAAGAIGINLEDGLMGSERAFADSDDHARKIEAVRSAASEFGVDLFINARTDPFLLRIGSPEICLEEAIRRANIYAAAGADGIFVPGLVEPGAIAKLVAGSPLPVNVMTMSPAVSISDLKQAGVARISLGPWPMMAAMQAAGAAARAVYASGELSGILTPS